MDPCLTRLDPWPDPGGNRLNLAQCWEKKDLTRFYTTSLGTQLVLYKLVVPLKLAVPDKADPAKLVLTDEPFFTKPHIEDRWRFLALEPSDWDESSDVNKTDIEDGWPVGFVIDDRTFGKPEWQGKWIGPTCAACHTGQVEYQGKKLRVAGGPAMADVDLFLQDLKNSLVALHEDGVKGGGKFKEYAERYTKRFGPKEQSHLLSEVQEAMNSRIGWHQRNDPPLPHGNGRLDAFGEIYNEIMAMTELKSVGDIKTDAPVSLPFLWDFSHHNVTQWNGSAPVIPLAFNVAGALAIFAKYDHKAGWFEDPSTARLPILRKMQQLLDRLRSPRWPQNILGPIDEKRAEAGKTLFQSKCQICHAIQERTQPLKPLKVAMIKTGESTTIIDGEVLPPLYTESKMTENAQKAELMDAKGKKMKASDKLVSATKDIILSSSHPGEGVVLLAEAVSAVFRWWSDLSPEPSPAYKARPLDGIWATAPYLHNGSVQNLYELLLPQGKRTKQFCVGNREFDPKHVGFVMTTETECSAKNLFWLDTTQEGNHNTGHDGPRFGVDSDEQIGELVEYLKTL
jgi:hypothetical protein